MLFISNQQLDALKASGDEAYRRHLAEHLRRRHPDQARQLDASALTALVERVVDEASSLGVDEGRVIARLATAALLVDADLLSRPEVKALFAFSGLDANLKADLLCDQIAEQLGAVAQAAHWGR